MVNDKLFRCRLASYIYKFCVGGWRKKRVKSEYEECVDLMDGVKDDDRYETIFFVKHSSCHTCHILIKIKHTASTLINHNMGGIICVQIIATNLVFFVLLKL